LLALLGRRIGGQVRQDEVPGFGAPATTACATASSLAKGNMAAL
jgi:hypothetical protein